MTAKTKIHYPHSRAHFITQQTTAGPRSQTRGDIMKSQAFYQINAERLHKQLILTLPWIENSQAKTGSLPNIVTLIKTLSKISASQRSRVITFTTRTRF